jgi:tetratricopeptide (TPR) repeat protein
LKHINKSFFIFLVIFAFNACVSTQKKGESKGIGKLYQNVTAKYNGYFNADLLLEESFDKLTAMHQDNYTKILDLYPYEEVDNPKAIAPDVDKAIEKVAIVATLHRQSDWTDDCYLLIGKSQFLKKEYETAEETFAYLTENWDPSTKNARDKKARAAALAESKKEKESDRKDKMKEKAEELKEKKQTKAEELKEKRKASAKAAEERKKLLEEKRKVEEEIRKAKTKKAKDAAKVRKAEIDAKIKEDREARQVAIDNGEDSVKVTKSVVIKTGKNATPILKETEEVVKEKKQKVTKKPDSYFLKHRPCYQEGMLWLARTHIERQHFGDAEDILVKLEKNPKTFKDIRAKVALAHAHLYLRQKKYDEAIPFLNAAIEQPNKKYEKVRAAFILAQIQQMKGNTQDAFATYKKVPKFSPSYEMDFNARLNMAVNSSVGQEESTKRLLELASDFKNKEYTDQIYFALAQISLKNKETDKAVDYLQKSLASGGRNNSQKTESYYTLAKLYYQSGDYVKSKTYYDSTKTSIDKNDSRLDEVNRYAESLADISKNIKIISLQDSLLRIAGMTTKEQKLVAGRIKKAEDDAKRAEELKNAPTTTLAKVPNPVFADPNGSSPSTFFAYKSADDLRKSKREFEKKWGDRKLEDNWRRSNKRSSGIDKGVDSSEAGGYAYGLSDDDIKRILKDVPKNASEIASSNDKVSEAMYQLGTLYHDKLQNDTKCSETLEKRLDRFANNAKHEADSWYYLHVANTELKNTPKAKEYYDKLQQKYPESTYARVLKDPNFAKNKQGLKVENYYDTTYTLFQKKQYKQVVERVGTSETTFKQEHPFRAKFAMLNAMSVGNLQGKPAYILSLKDLIGKYGESAESKRAKEILRILETGGDAGTTSEVKSKPKDEVFKSNEDALHYVIIVLPKEADLEMCKISVSDFNGSFVRSDNILISSVFLSTETEVPVMVLRKFVDKKAALAYIDVVAKNGDGSYIKGTKYDIFAVTSDNYREILRQKSVEDYKIFYDKSYK